MQEAVQEAAQEAAQVDRGLPLILVKSDGGFNYATTDMACLWFVAMPKLQACFARWTALIGYLWQVPHQ